MANALFDFGRESYLDGNLDWTTQLTKLVLVDHGVDTPVPATDQDLADITAGARIATSAGFGTKTSTAGVADAADITLTSVSGASVESIVIYFDSTVEATSTLIAFIDTATGLPVTPNGGDITITWDSGANKIFKL